jgi:hypothetical protein
MLKDVLGQCLCAALSRTKKSLVFISCVHVETENGMCSVNKYSSANYYELLATRQIHLVRLLISVVILDAFELFVGSLAKCLG